MSARAKPCCFFDRDGIVNRDPSPKRYVDHPDEFHIFPAFIEALRVAMAKGYAAVIVTNQKGVGTGVVKQQTLDAIHDLLLARVREAGLKLHDIFVCTATEDSHPNRKPNPGMILDAATKHGIDLSRSWMIGDNESDVVTGKRAGCRTIRVCAPEKETAADFRVDTIEQLPDFLRRNI
jgi:histidinol-phosphate phosphatase family protein